MPRELDLWEAISRGVARVRQEKQLSQAELASFLRHAYGLSWTRTTVSNLEAGQKRPNVYELHVLVHALGSSEAELLGEGPVDVPGIGTFTDGTAVQEILTGKQKRKVAIGGGPAVYDDPAALTHAAARLGTNVAALQTACRRRWRVDFTTRREQLVKEAVAKRRGPVSRRSLQAFRAAAAKRIVADLRSGRGKR